MSGTYACPVCGAMAANMISNKKIWTKRGCRPERWKVPP